MKTLFIATVGIGTGPEADIVPPLINSIREANPSYLLLFPTTDSEPNAERIISKSDRTSDNCLIHCLIADKSDVEAIFKEMSDVIIRVMKEQRINPENVIADFTTGTKPMSAALALAAVRLGLGRLKYIIVKRDESRRVQPGTERTITFEPRGFQATFMLKTAIDLMRNYRFDSVLQILESLPDNLLNESEKKLKKALTFLAQAYSGWDLFEHKKFASNYRQSELEKITELSDFKVSDETITLVEEIGRSQGKEIKDIMIVDLINNARRRIEEGKYDDAVARLYRACEMLAQWRLLQKGINTSDVNLNKVPEKSKSWLSKCQTDEGKIEIGLAKSYRLLTEMGEELGKKYTELKPILKERNNSILAHGLKPIPKNTAEGLLERILTILKNTVIDFDRKGELLKFPWSRT